MSEPTTPCPGPGWVWTTEATPPRWIPPRFDSPHFEEAAIKAGILKPTTPSDAAITNLQQTSNSLVHAPIDAPTPETDSQTAVIRWDDQRSAYLVNKPAWDGGEVVAADHARRLERERDEARAELAKLKAENLRLIKLYNEPHGSSDGWSGTTDDGYGNGFNGHGY